MVNWQVFSVADGNQNSLRFSANVSFTTDKEVLQLCPCNESIHTLCVENEEKMVFRARSSQVYKCCKGQRSGYGARECVRFESRCTAPPLRVNEIL